MTDTVTPPVAKAQMSSAGAENPAAKRGNLAVFAAFSAFCLGPMVQFWGAVFRPVSPLWPRGGRRGALARRLRPGARRLLAPLLLPAAWFGSQEGERGVRLYRALGVALFKRFATDGDVINGWRGGGARATGADRIRMAEAAEQDLGNHRHELSPVFHLASGLLRHGTAALAAI
jgi:hypothetical protein